MTITVDFDRVRELLPQAYPFVMVDRVESFEKDQYITCLKNITGNEWAFPGHFPKKAIYPGVLIIEGIAQSGILLFQLSQEPLELSEVSRTFLLTSVKTRFLKPVVPGDQMIYRCEMVKKTSTAGIIEGVATVGGEPVAKAEMTFYSA